jgi:type II secretory pathway pseudopilin PulG
MISIRKKREAGFTLIELMFTAAIMVTGIVILMQGLIDMARHSQIVQIRVTAKMFNASVMETIRGRGIEEILQFNRNGGALGTTGNVIRIPGLESFGKARLKITTQFPGEPEPFEIPVADADLDTLAALAPNPIEITVLVTVDRDGIPNSGDMNFRTSTLVFYY